MNLGRSLSLVARNGFTLSAMTTCQFPMRHTHRCLSALQAPRPHPKRVIWAPANGGCWAVGDLKRTISTIIDRSQVARIVKVKPPCGRRMRQLPFTTAEARAARAPVSLFRAG